MLQPLHFDIHSVALRRWNEPLCGEYTVLLDVSPKFSGDLKPYFYSFSCYGYLWRGSWLEATINSVPSSLWQTRLWLMKSVRTSYDHTRVDELVCTYAQMQSSTLRCDSGTDTCVISPSVVRSHCQFVFKSRSGGECVKSILRSFKEQPATTVWQQRWPLVTSLCGSQWKDQLIPRLESRESTDWLFGLFQVKSGHDFSDLMMCRRSRKLSTLICWWQYCLTC